jgi:polar amino acid transport system substrate-binding protein
MTIQFAYINEPPFVSPSVGNWPGGCDGDLAAAVLTRMGIASAHALQVRFADLIPGVAGGRWTFNTALFITPEREALVRFSRPVWALPDGLMVLSGNVVRFGSYEAVAADPLALLGIVAGQVQGTTAMAAGVPDDRIIRFASPDLVVAAVRARTVSAYASVAMAHRGFLAQHPDKRLAFSNLGEAGHAGKAGAAPALGAFSFARDDSGFADDFDQALGAFPGSDAHVAIMARYGFSVRDGIAWG